MRLADSLDVGSFNIRIMMWFSRTYALVQSAEPKTLHMFLLSLIFCVCLTFLLKKKHFFLIQYIKMKEMKWDGSYVKVFTFYLMKARFGSHFLYKYVYTATSVDQCTFLHSGTLYFPIHFCLVFFKLIPII